MHRTEGYKNKDNKFEDLETVITADPLNAWQEELANVVESSGINLNSADTDRNVWGQLSPAIANYVQNGRYYEEESSGPVDEHIIIFSGESKRQITFDSVNNRVNDIATPRAVDDIIVFVRDEGGYLPAELSYNTKYYVILVSTDYFQISETMGGSLRTFSDPGYGDNFYVFSHIIEGSTALTNGDKISFKQTTGFLPTGLKYNILYYVVSADINQFQISNKLNGDPIAFPNNGTGLNAYFTAYAYVLKGIDIGISGKPSSVPSKFTGGNYIFQVFSGSPGIATTIQLPGLDAKPLVRMDYSSDPLGTDLKSDVYLKIRYSETIGKHIILNTNFRLQGRDLFARIINVQNLSGSDTYPTSSISFGSWQDMYVNKIEYNNIEGVSIGVLATVGGWGEVTKSINISYPGKYVIKITIPWMTTNGDSNHALRVWDFTNGEELIRGVATRGEPHGLLNGIIDIRNAPIIINVQRYSKNATHYLVKGGGIGTTLKDNITIEIFIQKIA